MSLPYAVPEAFAGLTELSLDATGTFVLAVSDDYFAPAEALLRPHAPEWREGAYTERGKWMDGWESRRRRSPGHDWVLVRLGTPGRIAGLVVDTTHFKGNAPQEVSLEAIDAPLAMPAGDLLALPVTGHGAPGDERAWTEVLPRTGVRPDTPNLLHVEVPLARASHVRLRIHPDGGVARLRVFGEVRPDPDVFRGPGSLDLAAIENGGTIALASDSFFGPPSNLLLPGRGTNMGDGWETKRRRTPGSDWCVVRLGRRGVVQALELDTHFFKGNAPVSGFVEVLDEADAGPKRLGGRDGWQVLVERTALGPHRRHRLLPAFPRTATHLRVHITPHGGVNRLRVHGEALDTPAEAAALARLNALEGAGCDTVLAAFCAGPAFARALAARLPAASVRALLAAAGEAVASLDERALLEALAVHPRLGEPPAASATSTHAAWSRREQAALEGGHAETLARLRAGGAAYEARFGFGFIAFASGRGPAELADLVEERLGNDRATELAAAAREQARITRLRIGRWLDADGA